MAEARAILAALVERALNADLTNRQLKEIRDDIRDLGKRFAGYVDSESDDGPKVRPQKLQRAVEVMQVRAAQFEGEKREKFEARAAEFQTRFDAATDDEYAATLYGKPANRIEGAQDAVVSLINRIIVKLDGFVDLGASPEVLAAASPCKKHSNALLYKQKKLKPAKTLKLSVTSSQPNGKRLAASSNS